MSCDSDMILKRQTVLKRWLICTSYFLSLWCVCACVNERASERERERESEKEGVYVCVYSIVRASFTLEADISLVSIGLEPSTSAEELLAMSRGTIQTLHINITQTTAPQCNGLYEQSQGCSSLPPPPPPPPVVSACSRSCQHISL